MHTVIIHEDLLINKPTRTRHLGVIRHLASGLELTQAQYVRRFGYVIKLSEFCICGRGYQYIDDEVKEHRETVEAALRRAWGGHRCYSEAVCVWYIFGVPMPQSWSLSKKKGSMGSPVDTRPDEGNYTYALDNRLEGIAFDDDKLIASKRVCKKRSLKPFTVVSVGLAEECENEDAWLVYKAEIERQSQIWT